MEPLVGGKNWVFCAMDFSGNQKYGNCIYLAVVACTVEFLNQLIRGANLGTGKADACKKARRQSILAELDAKKPGCLILCVKTDKDAVLARITDMARRQKRNPRAESVVSAYHNAVVGYFRNDLDSFLKRHGWSLQEIKVESDHDCEELLKHASIQRTREEYAHMVADAVAWANNRGDEPPGVKQLDVTAHSYRKLRAKFGKRRRKSRRNKA